MNARQEKFVHLYILHANATQAAIEAGYSEKTAYSNGQRLLKNVEVKNAIEEEQANWRERIGITTERVLTEQAKLAFSDMRQLASWNEFGMQWRGSGEITDAAAACIKDLAMTRETRRDKNGDEIETVNLSLKLHDKKGALQDIAKHLGLFGKESGDVNVNVNLNGEVDVGRTAREIRDIDSHIGELDAEIAALETQAGTT